MPSFFIYFSLFSPQETSTSANHIVMLCYDARCFHRNVTCLNDKTLAIYQKCKAVYILSQGRKDYYQFL